MKNRAPLLELHPKSCATKMGEIRPLNVIMKQLDIIFY
jgi:hypothetical protein